MSHSLHQNRSGKRTREQIVEYVLHNKGVQLVEGFSHMLDISRHESNMDRVAAFAETPKAFRATQCGDHHLIWESEPIPATNDADVVILFDMATGYGSPLPQPAGRFDLIINGKRALSFCVSKSSRLWRGKEGASLYFHVKRQYTAQPGHSLMLDSQIVHEAMASFGLGVLRVPRALLTGGNTARLEVIPVSRSPSQRWFRVGPIVDLLSNIDFWPGLEQVITGRTFPRVGDYNVYFGDIHTHSETSDKLGDRGCGTGTREENFEYARDVAGLDLYALSEHDWQMNDQDWRALQHHTDQYYTPGAFATLHSFEWTSQGYGHRNVYYRDAGHSFFNSSAAGGTNQIDPRNPSPHDLWEALDRQGVPAITIPHHTSSCYFPLSLYDYYNPKYDRLIEIYSSWGSAEYPGNPSYVGDDKCADLHVLNFLNAGFRIGFVGSSDAHDACPGNSQCPQHKPRYGVFYHYLGSGRVAVLAEELTREAIFDALYQRRCYGTSGEPIVLNTTVDGHMMGSELSTSQVHRQPRIEVAVEGCSNIERTEICKNGRIVAQTPGLTSSDQWDWVDTNFDPSIDNYYYTRVIQVDGELAWSSPIWINKDT